MRRKAKYSSCHTSHLYLSRPPKKGHRCTAGHWAPYARLQVSTLALFSNRQPLGSPQTNLSRDGHEWPLHHFSSSGGSCSGLPRQCGKAQSQPLRLPTIREPVCSPVASVSSTHVSQPYSEGVVTPMSASFEQVPCMTLAWPSYTLSGIANVLPFLGVTCDPTISDDMGDCNLFCTY